MLRISCILAKRFVPSCCAMELVGPEKTLKNCDTGLAPHQCETQRLGVATMNVSQIAKEALDKHQTLYLGLTVTASHLFNWLSEQWAARDLTRILTKRKMSYSAGNPDLQVSQLGSHLIPPNWMTGHEPQTSLGLSVSCRGGTFSPCLTKPKEILR